MTNYSTDLDPLRNLLDPGGMGHEIGLACCQKLYPGRSEIEDMRWMTRTGVYDYSGHPDIP